ncbi:MAG: sulfite exporter TauE/SafE family protein [Gammaproteobacteria bacterium]|nr:sulfite exporter TauE/SafE family protein [Gammaproteobacteria bacterium]
MSGEWLYFPVVGILAGLGAGMFGIGGGFIIVAALSVLFAQAGIGPGRVMHIAIGTSLASIVLTSVSSLLAHHRRGAVLWPVVRLMVPGIVVGTLMGAWLAGVMSTNSLRVVFGALAVVAAVQIGFDLRPAATRTLPGRFGMNAAGLAIGAVSALAGIGGGAACNPFLLWCNVRIHNSVATAAACGLPVALAGTLGFVWFGWGSDGLPRFSSGYVYWPAVAGIASTSVLFAPVGAALAHALPVLVLRRAFAVLLSFIGLRMCLGFF